MKQLTRPEGDKRYDEATHQWVDVLPADTAPAPAPAKQKPAKTEPAAQE